MKLGEAARIYIKFVYERLTVPTKEDFANLCKARKMLIANDYNPLWYQGLQNLVEEDEGTLCSQDEDILSDESKHMVSQS